MTRFFLPLGSLLVAATLLASCGSDTTAPLQVGTSTDATSATGDSSLSGDGSMGSDASLGDGQSSGDSVSTTDTSAPSDSSADSAAKYPLCSELFTCTAVACGGSWGKDCAKPCLDGGSIAAKAALQPYLDCIDTYCTKGVCAGSSVPGCMDKCSGDKCFAKMLACGADGASGGAGCSTAFNCITGCQNKGLACYFGCYGGMSKAGQAQFDALTNCALAAGGGDAFAQCPSQSLACMADGKTGSNDCKGMLACTTTCQGLGKDAAGVCLGNCWASGKSDAQGEWLAVLACDSTPTAGCSDAFGKCIPSTGTQTCLDTLGCWSKCGTSQSCPFDCVGEASPAEGKKVADLIYCQNANCKYCAGNAMCEDTCRKTDCGTEWTACLAP